MEYIIQENVFREVHYDLLQKALDRLGLKYVTVRVFPFVDKIVALHEIPEGSYNVDDLPDYQPTSKNVFVFGALKLARVAADRGWYVGSLMNNNHDFEVYSKYYKHHLLNYDSVIVRLGDEVHWGENERKFIRPTQDTKSFTGRVFSLKEWKETVEHNLYNFRSEQFNENTPIQISTPKTIHKEVRCWVVDGKIVTASQYQLGGRLVLDDKVDDEAIEFAQSMVNIYQLAEAFVIDVCLTDDGWKIVECGCINCAGFYKSDLQKTIIALENKFSHNCEDCIAMLNQTGMCYCFVVSNN